MEQKSYSAGAPGSIMLFGEHAVLHGKMALVAAIDKCITVRLTPRNDNVLELYSDVGGNLKTHLTDLNRENNLPKWQFVLASIMALRPELKNGFKLEIRSDFSDAHGLGSSAAVTVATLAVLKKWLNKKPISGKKLFHLAKNVILKVQGVGSGADVAASVFGGILAYRAEPLYIKKLPSIRIPLTLIYSGYKSPTPLVIALMHKFEMRHKKVFARLYDAIGECTLQAKLALCNRDWRKLGELMNIHQGLQDALGVSDEILSKIIFSLRADSNIFGAKISGAGLGDSVIGLGKVSRNFLKLRELNNSGIKQICVSIVDRPLIYGK